MKERQPRRAYLISLLDDCARTVRESQAFIALELASKSRFPKLLKTLESKIVGGIIGGGL
jgi:HEAT repeat protein